MVVVMKEKLTPEGTHIKYAVRLTIADIAEGCARLASTYAACVQSSSVRVIAQDVASDARARLWVNDVPGAYYHGTPPPPGTPGGRALYGRIPPGFEELGYPGRNSRGEEMLFYVQGNLPGRRDAGNIWSKVYAKFMLEQGFSQSKVDRKVFYIPGKITAGIHVDDCVSSVRDAAAGEAFHQSWRARFGGTTDRLVRTASGEFIAFFLGLRLLVSPGTVKMDSPRLMDDLSSKLDAAFALKDSPQRRYVSQDAPLASGALAALRARPVDGQVDGPVAMRESVRECARSLLGLGGYIVVQFRPDGALAYSAISGQISQNFTNVVWRAVLQFCAYLVATRDLALTFRRTGRDIAGYADSSALNGANGHSWGGYCLGQPGSGMTHYRVVSPKQLADSSGGNELITATLALKEIIAERIAAYELGNLPEAATDLHIDASVVLDGVAMDRVSRESRYLATKFSMVREAVADSIIILVKIATKLNPADIFTKALVGAALLRARALVLGHPILIDDSVHVISGAQLSAATHRRFRQQTSGTAAPGEGRSSAPSTSTHTRRTRRRAAASASSGGPAAP
jgi:hypothetical protein